MALKKLMGTNQVQHWIDREKISAIYEFSFRVAYVRQSSEPPQRTKFIVDGQEIIVDIHIDNAMNWFNSTD